MNSRMDKPIAAGGVVASLAGLTSAAACCVLPLALAGLGVGASGLAWLVPLRVPLTVVALLAVAVGWIVYYRRRRACALDQSCPKPARSTLWLLIVASSFVAISAFWPEIEPPLIAVLQ